MDTFRDHKDEMPILVFPHLVKKIMNVMFLFEEIRGPTCVPVGDIYCHQIFLEVQVVITRILRVQLRKSNIIIWKFTHQNQIYGKYER